MCCPTLSYGVSSSPILGVGRPLCQFESVRGEGSHIEKFIEKAELTYFQGVTATQQVTTPRPYLAN